EADLVRRAADLADPAADRDLLVEGDRRAVLDVALGEHDAELLAAGLRRVVVRPQAPDEGDPRRLEVAQEDDVVEMAVGVEVAEPDPLAVHKDLWQGARTVPCPRCAPSANPAPPAACS